jgi:hypothetical protein
LERSLFVVISDEEKSRRTDHGRIDLSHRLDRGGHGDLVVLRPALRERR